MTTLIRHLRTICHNYHLTSIVRRNFALTPLARLDFLIADHKHLHIDAQGGIQPRISLLGYNRETKPRTDLLLSR